MNIITDADFLDFMGKQESQFIRQPSDWFAALCAEFDHGEQMQGDPLPWPKTHEYFGMRPGEVSVWAGINGHGKSQVLSQVCAFALPFSRWLIASLEMPPVKTLSRMYRQIAGVQTPASAYREQIRDWIDSRLWLYDQLDSIESDRLIAMVHYAAQKLSINHIVIDSLMKCGIAPDDYGAQKNFVDRLCWAAKSEQVHIHLVHHIRKKEREGQIPDKFDIKGAGEITDMVDNVLIVHRNKDKEKKIREGKEVAQDEPDSRLIIAKQRHAGIETGFNFWFHEPAQQFVSGSTLGPMPFDFGNH